MICLLCHSKDVSIFFTQKENIPWRLYGYAEAAYPTQLNFYICKQCSLVFKDTAIRPTADAEKKHYLKHNNDVNDTAYVEYMLKMIKPLEGNLKNDSSYLDYGCGYSPVLSSLLKPQGLIVDNYDPYFYPEFALNKIYDVIFVSEAAEHFFNPNKEFKTIFEKLKPSGQLIIRTKIVPQHDFGNWWYMRDPTHVVFYSNNTFQFLSNQYHCCFSDYGEDIIVFSRRN